MSREVASILDIELYTTAGDGNGSCERVHGVIDHTLILLSIMGILVIVSMLLRLVADYLKIRRQLGQVPSYLRKMPLGLRNISLETAIGALVTWLLQD